MMQSLVPSFDRPQIVRRTLPDYGLCGFVTLFAFGGVLAFATINAEEPAPIRGKSTTNAVAIPAATGPVTVAIPECLTSLKLSTQQQDQIKEVVRTYDTSSSSVWKQLSGRYMQAITLESSLLAAIEDNFTDAQREQVRTQRHKTAHEETLVEFVNEKSNQITKTPSSAVEDDLAGVVVKLTSEQEATADRVQEKYRSQMRSLKRDIQGLHIRLVSLESDKLVAIEKLLTKEQITELRSSRQNAPTNAKIAEIRGILPLKE